MKSEYRVVIVGAGPAGSNLARRINSEKGDVLLLDGAKQRGAKVCGGLISPDAQDLLAEYDISIPNEVLASPQLFSVKTIDLGIEDIQYYRRNYMNVDREKFDKFLKDMVPETIDKVEAVCKKIVRLEMGYELTIHSEEGEDKVRCKYLIGADGANSIVRRTLFPKRKIQRYTAIQQWFDADEAAPFYSCVFDSETSPSCSWVFFKDGKLVFGGAFAMKNARTAFEKQKEKLIKRGIVPQDAFVSPLKTEACLVARPYFYGGMYCGKHNAFLVGEAAGFISPSSLEGISYALASGEALATAFAEEKDSEGILHKYRKNIWKLKWKIRLKCLKRPFMYHKFLRALILKSGISAIKMKFKEEHI